MYMIVNNYLNLTPGRSSGLPMNSMPALSTISTNAAFSDKNP